MSFTFRMTQEQIVSGIQRIPATESAFVALVQELFEAVSEHVCVLQNGKLLQTLYGGITSVKFKAAFKQAATVKLPVVFDEKTSVFSFSHTKCLGMLKRVNILAEKPKNGGMFEQAHMEKLAVWCCGQVAAQKWSDFKAPAVAREPKPITQAQLDDKIDKLRNLAQENKLTFPDGKVVEVAQTLPPTLQGIVDLAMEDPHFLKKLEEWLETAAQEAMKNAA